MKHALCALLVSFMLSASASAQTIVQLTVGQWNELDTWLSGWEVGGHLANDLGATKQSVELTRRYLAGLDSTWMVSTSQVGGANPTLWGNLDATRRFLGGVDSSWMVATSQVGGGNPTLWGNLDTVRRGLDGTTGTGLLGVVARGSERTAISDNTANTLWKNLDLLRGSGASMDSKLTTANGHLSDLVGSVGGIASTLGSMATTLSGMSVNVASIAGVVTVNLPAMTDLLTSINGILDGSGLIRANLTELGDFLRGDMYTTVQSIDANVATLKSDFQTWSDPEHPGWESWASFATRFRQYVDEEHETPDDPEVPSLGPTPTFRGISPAVGVAEVAEGELSFALSRPTANVVGTPPSTWVFETPFSAEPFVIDWADTQWATARTLIRGITLLVVTITMMLMVWAGIQRA